MSWLGVDIGGANLKLADGNGFAQCAAFPLWKQSRQLAQELRTRIAAAPACDHLAITMTGELADCFDSKAAGVDFILRQVVAASDGRHTRVYLSDGTFVAPRIAATMPLLAASSNWHALARFAGRWVDRGPALLVDVGSTTCDVIPLLDGQPCGTSFSDTDRLLSGELVYTGVQRSPICAIVDSLPYRDRLCPVAQEWFATASDAYLTLGDIEEDASCTNTADGRPSTKRAARSRLARMVCADDDAFDARDAEAAARAIAAAQTAILDRAIQQVVNDLPGPPQGAVISGQGEFLARRAMQSMRLDTQMNLLSRKLGSTASQCAPAHALAVLAREAAEV